VFTTGKVINSDTQSLHYKLKQGVTQFKLPEQLSKGNIDFFRACQFDNIQINNYFLFIHSLASKMKDEINSLSEKVAIF
jgi:hypothetical protein